MLTFAEQKEPIAFLVKGAVYGSYEPAPIGKVPLADLHGSGISLQTDWATGASCYCTAGERNSRRMWPRVQHVFYITTLILCCLSPEKRMGCFQ